MRLAAWVCASVATVLAASPAAAECEESVVIRELRQGVRLRYSHRDADALRHFEGLWRRCGDLQALAQMAQTELALERWLDARNHLVEALAATNQPVIARLRPLLVESLREAERHLARVRVRSTAPGATLQLDDQASIPLPAELWTTPGSHTLRVAAEARRPESQTVTLAAGAEFDTNIELQSVAPPPPPPPPPRPPPDELRVRVVEHRNPLRTVGFVTLGVGAAVLIGGGVFWGLYARDYDASQDPDGVWGRFTNTLSDAQRADAATACRAAPNGSEAADFCTRADLYRTLGFALSIGGAAVSTAGALMAALATPAYERVVSHPRTSRVTVSPLAHPGAQGAIVTWTF